MLNGLDTPTDTTGSAHALAAAGIQAVGFYARPDRASKAMIDGLHEVGIKVWAIWEKGEPTSVGYFNAEQGTNDANAAVDFLSGVGVPHGAPVFACVDYDASNGDVNGPVLEYMTAFHAACRAAGLLAAVYGSGLTCRTMINAGVAHYGFLAGSGGYAGYDEFLPDAAIVQGNEDATVAGFAVDLDTVKDETVCW